jgi:hypothetical protein
VIGEARKLLKDELATAKENPQKDDPSEKAKPVDWIANAWHYKCETAL